jgi:hypothetical protein
MRSPVTHTGGFGVDSRRRSLMHSTWDLFKAVRMSEIDDCGEAYQFCYVQSICIPVRYR